MIVAFLLHKCKIQNRKLVFEIEQITKQEVKVLLDNKIIKHTKKGVVDSNDNPTGYHTTRHKKYIEEKFVKQAKELLR